ncbi:morphogenetic protein [Klebsiella oxytoca]
MIERGMIFNAEMVRALLNGRKTQTRRPVKFPVLDKNLGCELAGNELAGELSARNYLNSAFGKPGHRIWVRETFNGFWLSEEEIEEIQKGISKAADLCDYKADYPDSSRPAEGWTPSIHMPRWASRILLEITDVRVERLNSIHDVDAMREGIQNLTTCSHADFGIPGVVNAQHPVRAFQLLWESIYGAESWKANPWVWVIEFKRIEERAA